VQPVARSYYYWPLDQRPQQHQPHPPQQQGQQQQQPVLLMQQQPKPLYKLLQPRHFVKN